MPRELNIIGCARPQSFEITSGKMLATDPCYDKETGNCNTIIDNVKNGRWYGTVEYVNAGSWGNRVVGIWIWHESLDISNPAVEHPNCNEHAGVVCVDSGQAGFFDFESYPAHPFQDTKFYEAICALTLARVPHKVMEDHGASVWDGELTQQMIDLRESSDWDDYNLYYTTRMQAGHALQRNSKKLVDVIESYGSLANFGTMAFGIVSASGYGDGQYECNVMRDKDGQVVAGEITFIFEDEDDEEEDED